VSSFIKPQNTNSAIKTANRNIEEKQTLKNAQELGFGYINLQKLNINPDALKIIPEEDFIKGEIFVFFKVGKKLRIGVTNPHNDSTQEIITKLKQEGYSLNINMISNSSFDEALIQYENVPKQVRKKIDNILEESNQEDEGISDYKDYKGKKSLEVLNELFVKALSNNASDIHLEPGEKNSKIRLRIDGIMQDISKLENDIFSELSKQVKHQAKLKLNVTNRPQDGRTYFIVNHKRIDVRVSSLPSLHGEDIVLRILDGQDKNLSIANLGIRNITYKELEKALKKPTGMILAVGPTGSGKTTTLYTILKSLNTGTTKIITLEDPIEYRLTGITQSQINEAENFDFSDGLRSILRQDPDIVMVGEIRDKKTAEVATQASITGHKVLSTLHTNTSIGAIFRLTNMNVPKFMIAHGVEVVIAQRLIRKLCTNCIQSTNINTETKEFLSKYIDHIHTKTGLSYQIPETLKISTGCEKCNNTGFKGRTGIYEVLYIDENMQKLINTDAKEEDIKNYVQSKGLLSIFEDGILKVIEGSTTLEEIYRVTSI